MPMNRAERRRAQRKVGRPRRIAAASVVAIGGLAAGYMQVLRQAPAAYASTVCGSNVTSTSLLTQAINEFNANYGQCDTINITGSFTLTATPPRIDFTGSQNTLTITGGGTINGDDSIRPLDVKLLADDTLTISNLTLTHATSQNVGANFEGGALSVNAEGGIEQGVVILDGLTVSHSYASYAPTYPADGGGIYLSVGSITATDLTLTGNSGKAGGGAYFGAYHGDISLTNVVATSNTSSRTGGALCVYTDAAEGVTHITDSTFTDDTTVRKGGAIYLAAGGSLYVTDSAFSGGSAQNGGAIYLNSRAAYLLVQGSTFAQNYASQGGGAIYGYTYGTDGPGAGYYNTVLVDDTFTQNVAGYGGAFYGGSEGSYYMKVENSRFVDNQATSNGGGAIYNPEGEVLVLSDSSFDGNYSIEAGGAVYQAGKTYIHTSTFTDNESRYKGGAIYSADALSIDDTLIPDDSSYFAYNNAWAEGGAVFVNSSVTASGTVFKMNESGEAGNRAGQGGGLYANGQAIIDHAVFTGNVAHSKLSAVAYGGGLYAAGAPAYISDSRFVANVAGDDTLGYGGDGGAVVSGGYLTVEGSTFESNSGTLNGGAIRTWSGMLMSDSQVLDNTAALGGGIFAEGQSATTALEHSTIAGNHASVLIPGPSNGGGIYAKTTAVIADYTSIYDNDALAYGGGISTDGSNVSLSNSFVGSNEAYGVGGIFTQTGDISLYFTTVFDDTASHSAFLPQRPPTALYTSGDLTAVGSVIASHFEAPLWEARGTIDDTYSVTTNQGPYSFLSSSSLLVPDDSVILAPIDGTEPGTQSRMPEFGSVLIGAIDDTSLVASYLAPGYLDQAGVDRNASSAWTMGSREFAASVTSVSPNSGWTAGGYYVTIKGGGFTPGSTVTFDGLVSTDVQFIDSQTLSVKVPAHAVGAVDVSVTSGAGQATLPSAFTYRRQPAPSSPPSPPRNVSGVPGDRAVTVSWAKPASEGTSPITTYKATASPGGASCTATAPALTCTVTGLANGTSYRFTVSARNSVGWGLPGGPSASVTPSAVTPAPAPEPLPAALAPGDSLLMHDGVPDPNVQVDPNRGTNGLVITGDDWNMNLDGLGPDGKPLNLGPDGSLRLATERDVQTSGTGFLPNSEVDLYVDPPVAPAPTSLMAAVRAATSAVYVGTVRTDANGNFTGTATLPAGIEPGDHVLQAVGYSPSRQARAMSLGVIVERWIVLDKGNRKPASHHDRMRTTGTTGGIDAGVKLTPHVRLGGQSAFKTGVASIVVKADGSFTWSRLVRKDKRMVAYVSYLDTDSNRVVWVRVR